MNPAPFRLAETAREKPLSDTAHTLTAIAWRHGAHPQRFPIRYRDQRCNKASATSQQQRHFRPATSHRPQRSLFPRTSKLPAAEITLPGNLAPRIKFPPAIRSKFPTEIPDWIPTGPQLDPDWSPTEPGIEQRCQT